MPWGRRPCALSWRGSRRSACSSTRTPRLAGSRPTRLPLLRGRAAGEGGLPALRKPVRLSRHAARGRRGHARHNRAAVPGHEPARARHRPADRDGHDPSRRGAAAAAAGGDGRGHHLHGRGHQARDLVRGAARPRPGRLGRQLPQRGDRRARRRLADARRASWPSRSSPSASARSSPRSRPPSPSSRTARARCSWTARRGCCPSTASRSSAARRSSRCSSTGGRCSRRCASRSPSRASTSAHRAREPCARAPHAQHRGGQLRACPSQPRRGLRARARADGLPAAIIAVRQAATELSRFVAEVYDE